ncbi:polysaccharide pyruvyl transferase family protein [Amnibacterium soli]|uniref:Polysaccharide pyruvyl transferase family protein n=1 Tax=Amnibacterium soli TaxID=1282736 RepID=A0ABP8ZCJ7_9MICO
MIDELVDAEVPGPVAVLHWNPHRPRFRGRVGRRLPLTAPVGNFGDLLGPEIVRRMRVLHGGADAPARPQAARLLSVGSILHFARDGDVVWGSGVNGRIPLDQYEDVRLDVRAVRGPRTAAFLAERGAAVPSVFGDPALLVPRLMPELAPGPAAARDDYVIVPNLHDHAAVARDRRTIDPRSPWRQVVGRIARARAVYASSLHGLVIAEAFGVPAVRIAARLEQDLKYEDYALGSGGDLLPVFPDLPTAFAHPRAGRRDFAPDLEKLMEAFPHDLW